MVRPVLSTTISNKDEKPSEKAEKFYYLTEEANRKKEIEDYYDLKVALSGSNLADHLLSDALLDKLRILIKNKNGQKFDNHEIAVALVERLFNRSVITEVTYKRLEKIKRELKHKRIMIKAKQRLLHQLLKKS